VLPIPFEDRFLASQKEHDFSSEGIKSR